MNAAYYRQETVHGYPLDEVVSALQKTIRRGMTDDACWFATEMNVSGFGAYAWRRLLVIVTEDIGLANPQLAAIVHSLYAMSEVLFKAARGRAEPGQKEKVLWNEENLLEAVWLLAESPKSRELVDMSAVITQRMQKGERLEVPSFALDQHTTRGRAMGRGIDHFNEAGDQLHPRKVIGGDVWGKAWEAERPHDK
jgi:replication-associated recombination protein RarA